MVGAETTMTPVDAVAMRDLLKQEGRLLRLGQNSQQCQEMFERLFPGEDHISMYAEQIEKEVCQLCDSDNILAEKDALQEIYRHIEWLADLPEGREEAMYSIVDYATSFCEATGTLYHWGPLAGLDGGNVDHWRDLEKETVAGLDWLLTRLLQKQFKDMHKSGSHWDLEDFQDFFVNATKETETAPCGFLRQSLWYLSKYSQWLVASLLAKKAVGHRLPPELVEMVADSIHGDDVKIPMEKWDYPENDKVWDE